MKFNRNIQISNRKIGDYCEPFIIAEMSGNHNQSLERALQIVDAAKRAGAHAIKLQTYTADTMTLDLKSKEFMVTDPNGLWHGTSLYELYQKAYTPWEWHAPIFDRCLELGLIGFSSAFDASSVDFLESLNVPAYKIASFENTDLPLIRKIAKTRKPVILSTGMANLSELMETIQVIWDAGCRNLVLLKCTSAYPARPETINLLTIPHLKALFQCPVGLSDHTLGNGVPIASIAVGGSVIEKHFTLSRSEGGVDSAFSLEPKELSELVSESKNAWLALGCIQYGPSEEEKNFLKYRRSIYIVSDLKEGDILTHENMRVIRPGFGLSPKWFDLVLGRKVKNSISKGTPLSWDVVL